MRNINPKLRVSLYIVVAAAGAVLVTYGIIEQTVVDAILPVVAGVFAVAGGGVAAANTSVKPRNNDPSILEWARMGQAAIPALIDEVQRNRNANLQPAVGQPAAPTHYDGPSSVPTVTPNASGLPVYDQPSSALADDYTGRHRGE